MTSTKSSWKPGASSVHQESILNPVPFNISINDLGDGTSSLLKFADDKKLSGGAIQRHHKRLEEWADRNLMRSNQER